jgi:uncharacterized phiE125 gp8 family phage protein
MDSCNNARVFDVTLLPVNEPVTLAEAKLFCKLATSLTDVSFTADDTIVESYITSARDWCETHTRRAFCHQTLTLTLDSFPWGGGYFNRANRMNPTLNNFLPSQSGLVKLDRPPFVAINSITYLDTSGNEQTLSSSIYRVISSSKNATRLTTKPNQLWPATYPTMATVAIEYQGGYSVDGTLVPEGIKTAIKLLVSHWYNNRDAAGEANLSSIPYGVESILIPWCVGGAR